MNNIESSPGDPEVMAACGDLIILTCSVEITNRNADWMARFAGILKVGYKGVLLVWNCAISCSII